MKPLLEPPRICSLSVLQEHTGHSDIAESTRRARPLPTELLPSWVDPSLCCTPGLGFSRCKTLHLSSLNFTMFSLAHYSCLSRSFCMVALPSQASTSSDSLLLLQNFTRIPLIPSARSLWKMNSAGPSINLWELPGCQFEEK